MALARLLRALPLQRRCTTTDDDVDVVVDDVVVDVVDEPFVCCCCFVFRTLHKNNTNKQKKAKFHRQTKQPELRALKREETIR